MIAWIIALIAGCAAFAAASSFFFIVGAVIRLVTASKRETARQIEISEKMLFIYFFILSYLQTDVLR